MKKLILFIFVFPFLVYGDGDYTGKRILQAAQKYGMTDSELNYLIDNTAPDLTLKDPQFGGTALIHACINNRPNMVKILIERGGANIDEVDNNGETCLIGASRKGNLEVVNILLGLGANTTIVGNLNKSAYDYAVQFGHTEVARLLGGPPKQKVSFKTLGKLAIGKKPGTAGTPSAPSLGSQKYIQDLGKISLIVEGMKPVPGKGDVEKLNEIGKVTGFSDVVKKQMEAREQEEAKLRVEIENKRAKANSVMMAKLKAIAAFNNLYLDVSSRKGAPQKEATQPSGSAKLSFSDATSQLMNEMDLKLKKKEDEIKAEKQRDIERGATERINAIKALIFAGSKGKNIDSLKNEPEEKLKEKVESIKNLLDVKESKEIRRVSLDTTRKKINVINGFQSAKASADKMKEIDMQQQLIKLAAIREAKMAEAQRLAELAKIEERERENFYKLVQEKAKVAKFTENLKQKSGVGQTPEAKPFTVEEESSKKYEAFADKKGFDELRGVIVTPDFLIWPLTNRDCQIKRNPKGTFYVIISKFKLSRVVQTTRKDAIWFINTKEKPTPPNGGLECKYFCKDPALYVGNLYNNPKREVFLSNVIIQLGIGPLDSFEIYSSVPGNKVIKVPITDCKMAF